jgi:acetylornithine deacetylase/succinyl-diaminopimelate desuccinylase-like protein
MSEVLDVARRLIAAASQNPPGDERRAVETARTLLTDRGIDDLAVTALDERRPNLVARLKGRSDGRTLGLVGHLDTKPTGPLDAWPHDPFSGAIHNGFLHGIGAADMKGAVAAMIVAAAKLHASGGPAAGDVLLVLCADEEAGSHYGARFLAASNAIDADAIIIGEPSGIDRDWECIGLACRGSFLFRIDVEGPGGHSSLGDRGGPASAARLATELASRLDAAFRELPGCAVNVPATITAGTAYGVTAATATLRGDVRLAPGVLVTEAAAILDRELSATDADGLQIRVVDEIGRPGFEAAGVKPESLLAQASAHACRVALGRDVPFGVFPGGTDAYAFAGEAGIPTIAALGPGRLKDAHRPGESVSVASLDQAVDIYLALVSAFLGAA